ncbi:MAG: ferritin-like domain-containing protein [Bacteroidales bacterium]|nr:ferritin-like domain-containing protein [Bacteroidales bacterium]
MKLFTNGLKDVYWAEKYLAKSLKKMAKAATAEDVRTAFEEHMTQTEGQVERLEAIFESMDKRAVGKKCLAMEGLVGEAEELIEETEDGTETRDVALISAAQKVEHYEIATYGTLRSLAQVLGLRQAVDLLQETLDEEKETDKLLTEIAESFVNESALQE